MRAAAGSVSGQGSGLAHVDGTLLGIGPDYKAVFDGRGMEYTPALGRAVERNHPVRVVLETVGRGAELRALPAAAAPEQQGDVVVVARGDVLVERYDVRDDGVELSCVLERPLPGSGDLVVRGRLETDLTQLPRTDAAEPLRLDWQGQGGVSLGRVLGIDADGQRVAGRLELRGDVLELALPADFVERARYPLVLDPLLGTYFSVTSGQVDSNSSVAYDATNNVYLVVWNRSFSAGDGDVRARRIKPNGTLVGTVISVESTSTADAEFASVGNCRASSRFLVAWEQLDNIHARAVAAIDGGLSAIVPVALDPAAESRVQVGSEATAIDDELLLVWREEPFGASSGGIRGRRVEVPPSGAPSTLSTFDVVDGAGDRLPRISHSGGAAGRYLVTWAHDVGTARQPYARLYDRDGAPLSFGIPLVPYDIGGAGSLDGYTRVVSDGDGTSFVAVWSEYDGGPPEGVGDFDILCRRVFPGGFFGLELGPITTVAGSPDREEIRPDVVFAGGEYVVAYERSAPSFLGYDISAAAIDPCGCALCEDKQVVVSPVDDHLDHGDVAVGSRYAGKADGDVPDALITWNSFDNFHPFIEAQLWDSKDGIAVPLGGGCGSGGSAVAACARIGNAKFAHRLYGAAPNTLAFLMTGFVATQTVCGQCTFQFDAASATWSALKTTDSNGSAAVAASIPANPFLIGVSFMDQWVVATFTGSCSILGVDLSNAVKATIE